jgi:glycosyltransferase involved in cell wall biosynthesis
VTFGCWASRVRAFPGMLAMAFSAPSDRRLRGQIRSDPAASGGKSRRGPQDPQGEFHPSSRGVEMLFVGSVVPDEPRFQTPAFSRAGAMFQLNLLNSLARAGVRISRAASMRPIPSFPRSRQLWVVRETVVTVSGIELRLLPFVNLTPLKQVFVGLGVGWEILKWRLARRTVKRGVVVTYNLSVPPGLCTYVASRLAGVKVVALLCDINVPGQTVPATPLRRFDYWLHRVLIPRLDGRVVVADSIADTFAKGRNCLRMEGGIGEETLARMQRSQAAPPKESGRIRIVLAGRLDETNGVKLMLGAAGLLPGDGYEVWIAGSGPLSELVRDAAAKDARIVYAGFLSLDEIYSLYRSADILVNARITQELNTRFFFPSKLLEFMATGIPVISTCSGRIEPDFGHALFLLKDETPQALASLIERVSALPRDVRADVGKAARDCIVATRTWTVQGQRIADYLHKVTCDEAAEAE